MASEYEATQLYVQLAESTGNPLAIKALREIADEELVHAGELLRPMHKLAPEEARLYAKGTPDLPPSRSLTTTAPVVRAFGHVPCEDVRISVRRSVLTDILAKLGYG